MQYNEYIGCFLEQNAIIMQYLYLIGLPKTVEARCFGVLRFSLFCCCVLGLFSQVCFHQPRELPSSMAKTFVFTWMRFIRTWECVPSTMFSLTGKSSSFLLNSAL